MTQDLATCQVCHGSGWAIASDGGIGMASKCRCRTGVRSAAQVADLLPATGMTPKEVRKALEPWDPTSKTPEPVAIVRWAKRVADGGQPTRSALVLAGLHGRGKTKAAAMAMAEYVRAGRFAGGHGARWIAVREWLDAVMSERREYGGAPSEIAAQEAAFLVVDELGVDAETGSEASRANRQAAMDGLIQYRIRRDLPTIYTTNTTDVAELGDARSSSRFSGNATVIEMVGEDYRDR